MTSRTRLLPLYSLDWISDVAQTMCSEGEGIARRSESDEDCGFCDQHRGEQPGNAQYLVGAMEFPDL